MSPAGLILIGFGVSNGSWGFVVAGFVLIVLDFVTDLQAVIAKREQPEKRSAREPEPPWFQQDKPMFPVVDDEFLSWERCLVLEYMEDKILWFHLEDELWVHLQHMRKRQAHAQWRERPAAPVKVVRRAADMGPFERGG